MIYNILSTKLLRTTLLLVGHSTIVIKILIAFACIDVYLFKHIYYLVIMSDGIYKLVRENLQSLRLVGANLQLQDPATLLCCNLCFLH